MEQYDIETTEHIEMFGKLGYTLEADVSTMANILSWDESELKRNFNTSLFQKIYKKGLSLRKYGIDKAKLDLLLKGDRKAHELHDKEASVTNYLNKKRATGRRKL